MQLDLPMTESPEQHNTVFEDFDNSLQKQNTFQKKKLKTLKNIFVFDQQKLSMWEHI